MQRRIGTWTLLGLALIAGAAGADPAAPTLQVRTEGPYGAYLVDGQRRPLYAFTPDRAGRTSTCYGACAQVWPPLIATGAPDGAATELDRDKLGLIKRRDGRLQVTYNGWPLYTYAKDRGERRPTGQDVESFGGAWYLVSPDGSLARQPGRVKP